MNEAHLNSGVRLSLKLYSVKVIKHIALFTICAKLTLVVIFTSLALNFYTSVSHCVMVLDLNKNIGRLTDLVKKDADRLIHIPLFTPLLNAMFACVINIFTHVCLQLAFTFLERAKYNIILLSFPTNKR